MEGSPGQNTQRAQSGPLGLLLVFALVIAGTTVVVAIGAGAITGTQDQLGSERTENAMTQLDSQSSLVALGSSNRQRVDMSAQGSSTYTVDDSAGEMKLSYEDQTTGASTTIFSEDLGSVTYQSSAGSQIAYQGGGVWRSDGDGGSVMVSPPEFHYRDATLTLPLVTVENTGTIDGDAVVTRTGSTQQFPDRSAGILNPLENARVTVTVTSEYYRAWGRYFETRTEGEVEYDDANNEVSLDLVTPLQNTRVTAASSSLAASGEFEILGKVGTICPSGPDEYLNSYNSSGTSDDYCDQTPGDAGDIVYGSDIDISGGSGNSDIHGNVTSGGTVSVGSGGGQPEVNGDIEYTDNCKSSLSQCESKSTGDVNQISGIDEAPAIDNIVRTQVNDIEGDNDNSVASDIDTSDTIDYSSGSASLTEGTYYLTNIDVDNGDTLELDTSSGDITIAVEEDVEVDKYAEIEVTGDGTVNVYVQGAGSSVTEQLTMGEESAITNDGDDAPQFRMFGPRNFTATIGDGDNDPAKYVGVIYAPPGSSGSGSVTLDRGVIYGGVLTGTTSISCPTCANGNSGSIHYDEALRNEEVLERSNSVVRVTYIHASTNQIVIEDG